MNNLSLNSRIVLLSLFVFFNIVACSPAKNDSNQTTKVPVLPQNQVQDNSINAQTPVSEIPETTTQQSSEVKSTTVTINPPHGEPGHRCDIPVGAPLNSAPATTPRQTISNPSPAAAPNLANNPTAPTNENAKRLNSAQPGSVAATPNSGRLNPPHGQPGHRCEIPVGSPLP